MLALAKRLKALAVASPSTKIVWVGSRVHDLSIPIHGQPMQLDMVAQSMMHDEGLPFLDMSDVLRATIPPGFNASFFTTDWIHWGCISYKHRPPHNNDTFLTASTLQTQKILGSVC